ncbi:MAG: hypothetical protein GQ574_09710 [Crocinitomix sp.]|nr:hypothetical protein [Crocinitomix sp.]
MKNLKTLFFLGLIINLSSVSWSQETIEIDSIKSNFKQWQPIIENNADSAQVFYSYRWGDQYEFSDWFSEKQLGDTLFPAGSVYVLEQDSLGFYVQETSSSPSGDWFLICDYYYHANGQLYFVFWRLNTFYAEPPVTVEKRFYYNLQGTLILEKEVIYKKGSNEKINVSYFDPGVDFDLNFFDSKVYGIWK